MVATTSWSPSVHALMAMVGSAGAGCTSSSSGVCKQRVAWHRTTHSQVTARAVNNELLDHAHMLGLVEGLGLKPPSRQPLHDNPDTHTNNMHMLLCMRASFIGMSCLGTHGMSSAIYLTNVGIAGVCAPQQTNNLFPSGDPMSLLRACYIQSYTAVHDRLADSCLQVGLMVLYRFCRRMRTHARSDYAHFVLNKQ